MLRVNSRLVGLVAGLALTVSANVQAGWGSYGGWSGGSNGGSWGSSGGSSGYGGSSGSWGGYGSSGGGYGSSGGWSSRSRLHHHGFLGRGFHHHRGMGSYGSNGSSGGSYGSYSGWGSSGGSYGGSSGGSSGGSVGGGTLYSPVVPDPPGPATLPEASPDANKATLKVTVPEDALVYVNGILTKSTGADRTYISRGLVNGFQYTYEVRAEAMRDGQKVEQTKVVNLKSGDSLDVAFSSLQAAKSADTTLTVNVPAEAKVSLGGNPTIGSGSERTFRTSRLGGDKEWSNYVVQVSIERDGRTVTQEKTITLKAGDNQTLSFDFDNDQIADAR